ncbi:cardiolipin synthase ClsB [Pseudomonas mangrovi]|jgi:cardiolipin synthase|uniref:Cardiolipin synthase B n=1 Tax=Pseudomonas mangrovi TaxID=2161748 RepID=A0A2T5P7H2_9PSED|nr:cardiolipin synthase ClsB [Pseudomonas mangrovi]PTU73681.1 cardiolipin synthase ClsB [Pseudomonas mangrovi]
MRFDWRDGNRVHLLENGEAFYPRVNETIAAAQREVLLETFILAEDKVGQQLRASLIDAARRGVAVTLNIDGFGSADLSAEFVAGLTEAGVHIQIFDPGQRLMGQRLNVFRRLHRKLIVIDGEIAFVGGINFSADHLADFGPQAKQDYAIEVEGPIVADIHRFVIAHLAQPLQRRRWWQRRYPQPVYPEQGPRRGDARMLFVSRDNHEHRNDIEEQYLEAIRSAHSRVVIANAYFFPGYRVLREIRNAARRGVQVTLILQGQPDMPIAKFGARMLYNYLLRDGVHIHEYCARPLHGKVALIDQEWSTVGSSNLDPLSLSLNLEANLVIRDRAFNQVLHQALDVLIQNHCRQVELERILKGYLWRVPLIFVIFHFLRHFPAMVGWFPAHKPRLALLRADPEKDVVAFEPIARVHEEAGDELQRTH